MRASLSHHTRAIACSNYFDNNRNRVNDIVADVTAGGVTVNDCVFHVGQVELPFGGVGASGMGRYHGFDGFETFSRKKGVYLQPRVAALDLSTRQPER